MSFADELGGKQLNTYCRICGYPFERPTMQEVCAVPDACDRRRTEPTYRVPASRLASVEERMRQHLIEQARSADPGRPLRATITYGNLCAAIDPEQRYWSWPRFRGI